MTSKALGAYMSTTTNFLELLGIEGVGVVELVQPILYKKHSHSMQSQDPTQYLSSLPRYFINIRSAITKD